MSEPSFGRVVASLVLGLSMILFGMFITGFGGNGSSKVKARYRKAVELYKDEEFLYALRTNVGAVLSWGTLNAVDAVRPYWAMMGFMAYKTVIEEYRMHERTVTEYRYDPRRKQDIPYTRVETYYSWDTVSEESKHASRVKFCGVDVPYERLNMPSPPFLETAAEGANRRAVHYALPASISGTLYANILNNEVPEGSRFLYEIEPDVARRILIREQKKNDILFWVMWIGVSFLIAAIPFCV